jgi:DNA-binding HxlR family transcriptional regulator
MARTLEVVGERWTLLVVREVFLGHTRFAGIRERLGVAPDVLTDRLETLVGHGLLTRAPYRDATGRTRDEYLLTDSGRGLGTMLMALAEWGDTHRPPERPRATIAVDRETGQTVRLALLREDGTEVAPQSVALEARP